MAVREIVTADVREHLSRASGAVEHALTDHLDGEVDLWPNSRAASEYLSVQRERFLEHMLEAAREFEAEGFEDWADGQADDEAFDRAAAL